MTEADDNVVDLHDVDLVFEQILAGDGTAPDAPAWYGDLARLVAEARVGPAEGELAAEHDVVQAMAKIRRIRLTPSAGADGDRQLAHDAHLLDDLVERWSTAGRHDPAAAPPTREAPAVPGGPGPSTVADPAASDAPLPHAGAPLRGVRTRGDRPPSDSGAQPAHHSPRHVSGRPRHAAGSGATPAPRPLARVLAANTAAVTTAVVIGTVAAAAATTGIMSKVVMPTLDAGVVKAAMSPWLGDDEPPVVEEGRPVPEGVGDDDETMVGTPSCPTLVLVCSPLTPAGEDAPATEAPGTATTPAKSGTGLVSDTTTTTAPAATEPAAPTTTTTAPAAPPPTEPPPATTTTSSTTTTSTPPPTEPGPSSPSDASAQSVP